MNPGLLNKKITILEQPTTQNSYGEIDNNWTEKAKVWANVRTLTGRALYQAIQVHAEVTVKVIVRYRANINANMRLQYGSRILEIIAPPVDMDEKHRYLELSCKEVI
ncbi:phage head closure protein [Neobacillus drentensis]|uniref:phage head closure protein n=1 Tax=Neobacillus drentensis TaxID=220684 RepID=UPI002FFE38BF